jgi:hypothetical protein
MDVVFGLNSFFDEILQLHSILYSQTKCMLMLQMNNYNIDQELRCARL